MEFSGKWLLNVFSTAMGLRADPCESRLAGSNSTSFQSFLMSLFFSSSKSKGTISLKSPRTISVFSRDDPILLSTLTHTICALGANSERLHTVLSVNLAPSARTKSACCTVLFAYSEPLLPIIPQKRGSYSGNPPLPIKVVTTGQFKR